MTTTSAFEDLSYLRALAEEGAAAPSVNGRYYITFGFLGAIALAATWAIASGLTSLDVSATAFVWLSYVAVTPLALFLLSRSAGTKPGFKSAGNRVTRLFWLTVSPAIFSIWGALSIATLFRDVPIIIFNMLPIIAFFAYGVIYMVEASLENVSWKRFAGLAGLASAFVMALFIGIPEAYLGAAIATLLIGVIPGAIMMRREPKEVV